MPYHILITGGSGLIGSRITRLLIESGHKVSHLSRSLPKEESEVKVFQWNPKARTIDLECLEGVDAIINLAGANVADGRWTKKRKKEILNSRIDALQTLENALKSTQHNIKTLVSASAIGYYGDDSGDQLVDENTNQGDRFLASVVDAWEKEAYKIEGLGIRVATIRIGVVLSTQNGALPKIATPIKFCLGAALGSGAQYMSWIHIDDLSRMFIYAITNVEVNGVYNATAPEPITNKTLTHLIAKQFKRPLIFPPVPEFFLNMLLGEMASMVLGGSKVSSQKITDAGFKFQHKDAKAAIAHLYENGI